IESVSTLDRSEELPTPQFDVSRILFSLERLFADEMDDEDGYTENQNICLSFFNKNRTRSSRTSCKNVTTTLKSSLTAMFEGVSLAVGGLFAMSNSDKVAELVENSVARDFDRGWGPLASVTIIEELLYSAVLNPDEQSIIIKRQDIRSGQRWPDIFVNLDSQLRMQQYSLENMAFTAISFLGPDLVVAVAESGTNLMFSTGASRYGEKLRVESDSDFLSSRVTKRVGPCSDLDQSDSAGRFSGM
ncbi:hypothetical protein HDU80_008193, partial [Chytriomyces hyalinus]